jgi:hypothetical protein
MSQQNEGLNLCQLCICESRVPKLLDLAREELCIRKCRPMAEGTYRAAHEDAITGEIKAA